MINIRGFIVVTLWTIALASLAAAKGNPQPEKSWTVDCSVVRQFVATYGEEAAVALARAAGAPDGVIARARICLRK